MCESLLSDKGSNKEQTSLNHIKPTAVDKQYLAVQACANHPVNFFSPYVPLADMSTIF